MKKFLFLIAFMLFGITAMAAQLPAKSTTTQKVVVTSNQNFIIPRSCSVSITLTATIGLASVSVTGSWTGNCSELKAQIQKLYKELKDSMPKLTLAEKEPEIEIIDSPLKQLLLNPPT